MVDYLKKISAPRGQSLVEIVVALALFAIFATSLAQLANSSLESLENFSRTKKAQILAQSANEAIRAISRTHWNDLIYSTSSLRLIDNTWQLAGEGQIETSGDFIRTLGFSPVYRLADGTAATADDPGAVIDILSQDLKINVSWPINNYLATATLEYTTRLTAWPAHAWEQTDWSGGSGQYYWSDNTRYYFDDDNLAVATSGAIMLKPVATSTYALSGYLTSSAYQIESPGIFIALSWSETRPEDCPECVVQLQIKTAPDVDGSPGDWTTNWSGPSGEIGGDYFTTASGTLIHNSHNGDTWLRYRLILTGNGSTTPLVDRVKFYYQ